MVIAAVVMSVATRNVKSEYNESKYLAFAIYNIGFAAVILIIIYGVGIEDRKLSYVLR